MRQHLFTSETRVPRLLEQVFPFFAAPENLGRITPPELRFRILTPLPIEMRAGALIDYRIQLLGVPMHWCTRITVWDPPREFVDEQLRGPYAEWVHRHAFSPGPDGTTMMRDEVRYGLPLGLLGEIVHPLVRRQIERIFRYRARVIVAAFGDPAPATVTATREIVP